MSQRLSFTKGVQLSHDNEATSHANNKSNITNNIHITTPTPSSFDVEAVEAEKPENPYTETPCAEHVVYTRDVSIETSTDTDVEFLKKVIAIYMATTRLYNNQQIVCSKDELIDLISTLTSGTVEIDTADIDIDCGCCSEIEIPYDTVSTVWVTDASNNKSVFKYQYPQYLSLFDQYGICLKLVRA